MTDNTTDVVNEPQAGRTSPEQASRSSPLSTTESRDHALQHPSATALGKAPEVPQVRPQESVSSMIRQFEFDHEGTTGTATPLSQGSSSQADQRLGTPTTVYTTHSPSPRLEDEVENPFVAAGSKRPSRLKVIKPLPGPRIPRPAGRGDSDNESDQGQSSTDNALGIVPAEPEQAAQKTQQHPHAASPIEQAPAETQPAVMNKQTGIVDDSLLKKGHRLMIVQKWLVTFALISLNFIFIFASWFWPAWWYIYLPFISFPLVLNCIMIVSITFCKIRNTIRAEKIYEPEEKEKLVYIIPCYNETREEVTRSLDSLVEQDDIDEHRKAIIIVCDGRAKGKGMEKSCGNYLMEDILPDQSCRESILNAYRGWDGRMMDIEIAKGVYRGVPYYCIVKEANQGKRDSLIVVRSFLHKHNLRRENPSHIFSQQFFSSLSGWLEKEVEMDKVDHLIGMDADTVFDRTCIRELLKESKYAHTVGVCGYVAVDFSGGSWNLWSLYQSSEYTIAQGLRRLHQSIATHKVSCLPGCCQLLKICETTCGDHVLIELFGYHPGPTDHMLKQIRATASEDRNHVCLMLTAYPKAQTRQALRARAYTDVPHSWAVFLSQRRRWTLGATSNDVLLTFHRKTQWFERILAFCNVLVWSLNVFVIASLGCMIVAFMHQPAWIIMAFVSIMLVPLTYYLIMTTWLPRNFKERVQFLCGLFIFVTLGPFLNITVMLYAVWNMDSFGWGKTRKVIEDDDKDATEEPKVGEKEPAHTGNAALMAPETANVGILIKRTGYDEEAAMPTRAAPATTIPVTKVTPPSASAA